MKSLPKVTITTAVALTAKQLETMQSKISKKHADFELRTVVDPSVMGGIKLTIDSQEIDETVYTKLEKVHAQLKQSIVQK